MPTSMSASGSNDDLMEVDEVVGPGLAKMPNPFLPKFASNGLRELKFVYNAFCDLSPKCNEDYSRTEDAISALIKPISNNISEAMPSITTEDILTNIQNKLKKANEFVKEFSSLVNSPINNNLRNHPSLKHLLERTPIIDLQSQPNGTSILDDTQTGIDGLEILETYSSKEKIKLPPIGDFKRLSVTLGSKVYIMKTNSVRPFVEGTIISIIPEAQTLFKVRFDSNKASFSPKLYTLKEIAYSTPADVMLPVGTRVVAESASFHTSSNIFRTEEFTFRRMAEIDMTDEEKSRYYESQKPFIYAGIIAEPPKMTNRGRYLLFFDDGYAEYIYHRDVYPVCGQSNDVADDVDKQISELIRSYLLKYPERPMVKLQKNQHTETEFKNKWWKTKVVDVDASMVKMHFLEIDKYEWIYRGSTRLKLLYTELASAEANWSSGTLRVKHNVMIRRPHEPYVEYTREMCETIQIGEEETPQRRFAARRTGGPRSLTQQNTNETQTKSKNTARKSTVMRYPSRRVSVTNSVERRRTPDITSNLGNREIREMISFTRVQYRAHVCSIACREAKSPTLYKGQNPFLIPICLNWERQTRKLKKKGLHYIITYRAPCGVHLRTMEEIEKYLMTVSSRVTIDMFSVDPQFHAFRSFKPKEILFELDDVTQGKENVPVSCINCHANEGPILIDYSANRFPGKNVTLNLDDNFLTGCDCTDNCQNASECACQRITNYAATGRYTGGNVGYKFRRLRSNVVTGIFECNHKCKCRLECGNRVVQNGLQVRLQMFKTKYKGWGIRCLDDLERGMFICIYAGQLLTEQDADQDGHVFGDEYLAELDHIEVAEQNKEGYESDAMDIEVVGSISEETTKTSTDSTPISSDSEMEICESDSDFESDLRDTTLTLYNSSRTFKQVNSSDSAPKTSNSIVIDRRRKELPEISSSLDKVFELPPLSPETQKIVDNTKFYRSSVLAEDCEKTDTEVRSVARKSSASKASLSNHMMPITSSTSAKSTRSFLGNILFIMDAKTKGNIGRYLNHSCVPNVFVQNVFCNSHDLRFPEVAFFAISHISAGTELTWDYNYEVNSVQGKVMYCYCDSRNCRGRLL